MALGAEAGEEDCKLTASGGRGAVCSLRRAAFGCGPPLLAAPSFAQENHPTDLIIY